MTADSIDLLCERCGQTFSAFLHQMADQNAKVVCPDCLASGNCKPAEGSEAEGRTRPVTKPH